VTIKALQDKLAEQEAQQARLVETKVQEHEQLLRRELATSEHLLQVQPPCPLVQMWPEATDAICLGCDAQEEQLRLATQLGEREQEVLTLQAAVVSCNACQDPAFWDATASCGHLRQDAMQADAYDIRQKFEQDLNAKAEVRPFRLGACPRVSVRVPTRADV
jgi:hypothetical protein